MHNTLNLEVPNNVIEERRGKWKKAQIKVQNGVLFKYTRSVKSASEGCVTDEV